MVRVMGLSQKGWEKGQGRIDSKLQTNLKPIVWICFDIEVLRNRGMNLYWTSGSKSDCSESMKSMVNNKFHNTA